MNSLFNTNILLIFGDLLIYDEQKTVLIEQNNNITGVNFVITCAELHVSVLEI